MDVNLLTYQASSSTLHVTAPYYQLAPTLIGIISSPVLTHRLQRRAYEMLCASKWALKWIVIYRKSSTLIDVA